MPDETHTPQHSPLPWRYQEKSDAYTHIVRSGDRRFIVQLSQDTSGRAESDARLIVSSVNAVPALVAALEEIVEARLIGYAREIARAALAEYRGGVK